MIMFSLYLTGKVPFRDVYIHGRISDQFGKKMSKSRGNVIDPLEFVEKYGADALRMGILVGGNTAARNTALSEDKVRGYRNFANKIWNMARFLNMEVDKAGGKIDLKATQNTARHTPEDKKLLDALSLLVKVATENLEAYRFTEAGEAVYQFLWHELADNYIEHLKTAENKDIALGIFRHSFMTGLKLLHPFMPFVTEKIWEYVPENDEGPIIIASWPS